MASVNVYYAHGNKRSMIIGEAAYKGARALGEKARFIKSTHFKGVDSDYAIFYGFATNLKKIFEEYRKHSKVIYIDLGYFHRRHGGRYKGYQKLAVNSRHPTEYFMNNNQPNDRFKELRIKIADWRKPGASEVLIAAMSFKAAAAENLVPMAWEKMVINRLSSITDKKLIVRPKPNCMRSRPLPGAGWSKTKSIRDALKNVHAVVTRHSNVAVDALIDGIPVFSEFGVSSLMGTIDLEKIDSPIYPENRIQFFSNLAYNQWNVDEITRGLPLKHLKNQGLIP